MTGSSNTHCQQQPAARFLSSLYHNLHFASTNICLLNLTTAVWQANRLLDPSLLVNGVLVCFAHKTASAVSSHVYNAQSLASFCCGIRDLAYMPGRRGWSVTGSSARTLCNLVFLVSYTFVAKDVAQLDLQSRFSLGFNAVQLQELRQSVRVTLALARIEWQVLNQKLFLTNGFG